MKKIIVLLFVIFMIGCSDTENKNPVLGKVDGKNIDLNQFKKVLVSDYAFDNLDNVPVDRFKSFFRRFYTSLAFAKEADEKGFFNSGEMKEKIDEKIKELTKKVILYTWWQKEVNSKIKIDDKEYAPFQLRRKVKHILIASMDRQANKKKSPEDVKKITDTVLNELKNGGDFSKLAQKYSDDPGSKRKGGELGWVDQKTPFVPPFKKAALEGEVGKVIGPVKTQFGNHIIFVEKEEKKSLADLKKDKKIDKQLKQRKMQAYMMKKTNELKKQYANEVVLYLDRLKNVKRNEKKNLYEVKGTNSSLTVGDFAKQVGPRLKEFQKNKKQLESFVYKRVEPEYYYLDALRLGIDKDPIIQKRLKPSIVAFKKSLYENSLTSEYRKKVEGEVTEKDMLEFYEKNKNRYKKSLPNFLTKQDFNSKYIKKLKGVSKNKFKTFYKLDAKRKRYMLSQLKNEQKQELWDILKPLGYTPVSAYDEVKKYISQSIVRQKLQGYSANLNSEILKKNKIEFAKPKANKKMKAK